MQGSQIESCKVTPTPLYIKVVNRRVKAEVKVGNVVQVGFAVSNSEVGLGSLRVEPAHLPSCLQERAYLQRPRPEKISLARDDKAFFMKVQDVVRAAVDEAKFMLTVDKLREALKFPSSTILLKSSNSLPTNSG